MSANPYLKILLIGSLLACVAGEAAAAAKVASAGANWATATWAPVGVPVAGDTCTINSGINLTITTAAVCGSLTIGNATVTATTLTIGAGGTLNITTTGGQTGNVVLNPNNVARNMTIAVGATPQTLTVDGTVTCSATNTQAITVSTGQVLFTRAAGLTWANCLLTVTNNNAGGSANFTGLLTQNSGTIRNITTAGTIDFDAGYTKTGGTFTTLAGETINFGNSLTVSTAALVFIAGSTANFRTNSATITPTANITFGNLTINPGALNTVTLAGNLLGVAGNLSVSTGTYDLAAFTSNRTAAGGTITVSNGALLKIGGTNPFPTNYTTFALGATSAVEYSGSTQNVASAVGAPGYGDLTLSGTLTKTALGSFPVRRDLSITGVTFAGTTFAHTVNRDVSNTGTHSATTGSITLSGGAAAHSLTGNGTYANLILNDANGATLGGSPTVSGTLTLTTGTFAVGANTLSLNGPTIAGTPANLSTTSSSNLSFGGSSASVTVPSSVTQLNNLTVNNSNGITLNSSPTVNGTLTFTSGDLITAAANTLTIASAGSISGAATANHVVGNLARAFSAAGAFTYTVGDGTVYAPLTLTFFTIPTGSLTVSATSGEHPDTTLGTTLIRSAQSVNRYWTLKASTLAGIFSAAATYDPGDLDALATYSNFNVSRGTTCSGTRTCASWAIQSLGKPAPSATLITASAMQMTSGAAESDLVVGEPTLPRVRREKEFIFTRELY